MWQMLRSPSPAEVHRASAVQEQCKTWPTSPLALPCMSSVRLGPPAPWQVVHCHHATVDSGLKLTCFADSSKLLRTDEGVQVS